MERNTGIAQTWEADRGALNHEFTVSLVRAPFYPWEVKSSCTVT